MISTSDYLTYNIYLTVFMIYFALKNDWKFAYKKLNKKSSRASYFPFFFLQYSLMRVIVFLGQADV